MYVVNFIFLLLLFKISCRRTQVKNLCSMLSEDTSTQYLCCSPSKIDELRKHLCKVSMRLYIHINMAQHLFEKFHHTNIVKNIMKFCRKRSAIGLHLVAYLPQYIRYAHCISLLISSPVYFWILMDTA